MPPNETPLTKKELEDAGIEPGGSGSPTEQPTEQEGFELTGIEAGHAQTPTAEGRRATKGRITQAVAAIFRTR